MTDYNTGTWYCDRADLTRRAFVPESFKLPLYERWRVSLNEKILSSCVGSELVPHLFVGSGKIIYCIDAENGSVVWSSELDARISSVPSLHVAGDGKPGDDDFSYVLFVTTESGSLYNFNSFTGDEIWVNNSSTGSYPIVSSPTAAGNYIGIVYQAHPDISFIRVVSSDGQTLREIPRFPLTNNTPFYYFSRFITGIERLGSASSDDVLHSYHVGEIENQFANLVDWKLQDNDSKQGSKTSGVHIHKLNGTGALDLVYSPREGVIHAINPLDGIFLWELQIPNDEPVIGFAYRFSTAEANIFEKTLIVGQANEISAYDLDGSPTFKWSYQHERNHPIGENNRIPQPAVTDKYVIFITGNSALKILDIETGVEIWELPLPAETFASPMITTDSIYVGCSNGELVAYSNS